jgi:hypothetical protein
MNGTCGIESDGISPRWGFSSDLYANPGLLARAIESRPFRGFSARLRGSTKVAGARRPQGPAIIPAGAAARGGLVCFSPARRCARRPSRETLIRQFTKNGPVPSSTLDVPRTTIITRSVSEGGEPSPASTRPSLPRSRFGLRCQSLIVGGVADHLHALVRLSRTMTITQLVETMKVESSALVSGRTSGAVGSSWYRIR